MSRYDEHGPVDLPDQDYGPEWWAMGQEYCVCGHPYDLHGSEGRCQFEDANRCECEGFRALANQ